MEKGSLHRMDYRTLLDLARAQSFQVVEAKGLDTRNAVRFHKDGREWIAVNSDLSMEEKTRAVGYLMANDPEGVARRMGGKVSSHLDGSSSYILTLCC